jgi:glycosyltransferase involved in cell wall biosynthesis
LISNLIQSNPNWNFIFVGPINRKHPEVVKTCRKLSEINNVHFLGGKTVQELAAYPQHFDVCIMPYNIDQYTKYINPLKLYEYMASGKPAVGSRIETLLEFRDLVLLPKTYKQWSNAIRNAMEPELNDAIAEKKRKEFAHRHDWKILVGKIAKTMIKRLKQIDTESWKKLK